MQKILAVAWTDLRVFLSDRGNLVGLLLIPSVLTIVLGLAPFIAGDPTIQIAIIDQDNSTQSAEFSAQIDAIDENYRVVAYDKTEADLKQALVNGDYVAAVIIPTGFSVAVNDGSAFAVRFYSNEDMANPSFLEPSIQAIIGQLNSIALAEQVGGQVAQAVGVEVEAGAIGQRASDILAQTPVTYDYHLTETASDDSLGVGFQQSVPGMGTMFVLFTILGGMAFLVREREQWTIQRLMVMPVSRSQVIGGKILAYFTLGMIQYAVIFLIGLAFGMDFGSSWLGLLLLASAFSLAATALTFAIATRLRSEGQASQLAVLLAMSLAALGGAWWPLEIVPNFMKVIGHFSPIAWAMDGFHDLLFYGGGLLDVLPEVGILLAIAAVLFVAGVLGFQYE